MITQIQISYILALLKHRNFQQAADACHVTQPTLSMQIKKAEETIGYRIINRDTYPISLTSEGEKLVPLFNQIQDDYDQLSITLQKLKGEYKAEIRLGIIPTISNYLVPELYAKWKGELSGINLTIVELTSIDLLRAVKAKEIDMGIMAGPIRDNSLEQQILYNEDILIYAPTIETKKITIAQLENENPWLLSDGNCLRTQMINFCKLSNNSSLKEWDYEGGNLQLLIKMVKQEGGYTLVPSLYVPYLNVKKDDIKTIDSITPIRQVTALHLSRNSKKESITKIIRIIQHSKERIQTNKPTELLPWDAL